MTAICKSNGKIFIGTDIDGIFRLDDTATEISDVMSSSLHLYPNPTMNEIFIRDELKSIKEIKIVDAIGRCVMQTLTNGVISNKISIQNLPAGIYTAIVDGDVIRFEKY